MAESFFDLTPQDRVDALEVAAGHIGRPADLLEKDVWVVWTLDALFRSGCGQALTFKGGTSLSKAYGVIDRFSEDVDLTYDIRALLPEFEHEVGDPDPGSRSGADRISRKVREALPEWVARDPSSALAEAAERDGLEGVSVRVEDSNLIVAYPASVPRATGYVRSEVLVEFGARSAGEPWVIREVTCDAAPHLEGVRFPTAEPRVLSVSRTFWEKATAAHVYCVQRRLRSERFARHWYDLTRLDAAGFADEALADREIALAVARYKHRFFREKQADGTVVDYGTAVDGGLVLVPEGDARVALTDDYGRMASAGLLPESAPSFDRILELCGAIQKRANRR